MKRILVIISLASSAIFAPSVYSQTCPPLKTLTVDEKVSSWGETLTGRKLKAPDFSEAVKAKLELDLLEAQAVFDVSPDRESSFIWLGRRLGYLGRYSDAVKVFSTGLEKFPQSYKLYRFRGRHRARNRDFSGAIADYEMGLQNMEGTPDSFEPDGIANAIDLTISTYRNNLHYYLGQTSFAIGDYQRMYDELEKSTQSPIALAFDDHQVAVTFWQYIALKKLGDLESAQRILASLTLEPKLIENHSYFKAVKVLQGKSSEAEILTNGDSLAKFALAMTKIFSGNKARGRTILQSIVNENALGYWPAEVELTREKQGG